MTLTRSRRTSAILIAFLTTAALCPGQEVRSSGRAPGLLVRFYDVGKAMHALPELAPGELPNAVKVVETLDLDGARGDFDPLKDNFVTEVVGYLNARGGVYALRLISDDGARLWIDGRPVIDNDGLHGPEPKDCEIALAGGEYRLRILHFDAGGGERLALLWKDPHAEGQPGFAPIPPANLTYDTQTPRETSPGKKRIIRPLRRGRPGDGAPLTGEHPSLRSIPGTVSYMWPKERWLGGRVRVMTEQLPEGVCAPQVWIQPSYGPLSYGLEREMKGAPYGGQLYINSARGESKRVVFDQVDSVAQGCAFRFGVLGEITVSSGERAFEMLAVQAMTNGFEIEFTKPLDPRVGWEPESYYVEQWPFDVEKGIAPRRDGVLYPVTSASVSRDRKKVFLEIAGLRTSHVVYLRLLPACISEDGELPWSTEAWYTLNAIPKDRVGTVLPPPARKPQNILTADERDSGWKLLFDGKTTRGWRGYRKDRLPDGWIVKDGCLVRVGSGGDVATVDEYDDFELKLEWRISAAGNSGVFFRVDESVGWAWETGPEMQVLDNAEHRDGRNPKTSAGSNYALHAPVRDVTKPVGLFNRARILARGNHIEHWLNGVKVVEYEIGSAAWESLVAASKFAQWPKFGRMRTGRIVLQDHGDKVWYRNIKIRRLSGE